MDRRRQSILGSLVYTSLLQSILLVAGSRGCDYQKCIDNYNQAVAAQPSTICGSVATAQECIEPCDIISIHLINFEAQLNALEANNCSGEATIPPPPCQSPLPDFNNNLDITELEDPIISYGQSDSDCSQDLSKGKSHCSMFTYSHIRQFSHNTIQTCSVNGQQTLIDNPKLSIEVTAFTNGESVYTNLFSIQLLIRPDSCTGNQPLWYTASAFEELPLTVSTYSTFNTGPHSVEVNVNSNGTVASILLPWAGTTIVIHRYAKHLGIVIHMPTEMAELETGLCGVGCSEGNQLDTVEHIKGYCPSNQESSMLSCKSKSSLLSELQDAQLIEQYLMACQIDVLNSQAYDVISVMSAIVTTCKLLPINDEVPVDFNISSASGSGESGSGFDDTLPTFPPVELNCTHLSGQLPNIQLSRKPEMSVNLSLLTWLPEECSPRVPKGDALRQCAMFTHSHLSPFDSYTIQTPSQPGTWTLLQYDSLLVTVTGVADPTSSSFTKLEMVNVTLHSASCTIGVTLSYSALASSSLPQEMTYSNPMFKDFLKPMVFDSDGNLTTMHIPMLNATIVIRRDNGFLSVIARVPAQFVPSIGGLCSGGFPDYSPDNFNNFLLEQSLICPAEYHQVLFDCFVHAQDPNIQSLDNGPMFTVGFYDVCRFDILKSLSYNGLSTIRSISSDLALLWDVGFYVYPSVELPTVATDPPEPSLPSSSTEFPTDSETEFSTTLTYPLESPSLSPSPLPSSLAKSPSSPSVSTAPIATSASTEKETQSVSIPVLQETPMPTEVPTRQPGTSRPSESPKGRPGTPRPPVPPRPWPTVFLKPLEESLVSETPSSAKTHHYTLSLLSLLVAVSLMLAFHLL